MISAIRWVSELIGIAGGDDVFPELALQSLGRDRVIGDAREPALGIGILVVDGGVDQVALNGHRRRDGPDAPRGRG